MRCVAGPIKSTALRASLIGAVSVLTVVSGAALAATQGAFGATSTGSIVVTASVPNRARISGLSDVSFANQDPNVAALGAQDVCVWSNTATKAYTVTASGSGPGNNFFIDNGAQNVRYSVEWNAASGQTTGTALAKDNPSASMVSTATHQTCAVGAASTSSLIIGISTARLATMIPSITYTGTLTLVVSPL